ncbi:MAG: hypothetical protein A2Y62_04175 [Candidatus Fischerbacteria bacterium RBG_13_37_8]|uniref:Uncharacterized protein n=1 Tax=Candidatus Fischerbacteria bacterium RBG_13_37_8 TaxID=1817863 RepID=A0A1F5V668_9BACT|nr:MAG: hypothetical protein A2Y62_04175 [Candidatus Fischerbacteria bacterium RBG_13_37_8]
MVDLINQHNEIIAKAKESKDYDQKKFYMEQAESLKKQIEEVRSVYSKMVNDYNDNLAEKRELQENPEYKELYNEIRTLEDQINTKAIQVNDLIPQLEAAKEREDDYEITNLNDQILKLKAELNALRKTHQEKLKTYQDIAKQSQQTK